MDDQDKKKKRERGPNFTPQEKARLLHIITKYKYIIDCKETSTLFSTQKKKCWQKICNEYNPHASSGPRNWIQLRNLYDCLKQKARKSSGQNKSVDYEEFKAKSLQLQDDSNEMTEEYLDDNKEMETQQINVTDYLEMTDNEENKQINNTDNEEEESTADLKMPETKPYRRNTDDEEEYTAEKTPEKKPCQKSKGTQWTRKSDAIKEKYFQLKLENAELEQKFMILENQRKQELHDLKVKLLKEELSQF